MQGWFPFTNSFEGALPVTEPCGEFFLIDNELVSLGALL